MSVGKRAITKMRRAVGMLQGIQGVRFKRLIMDESVTDRSPRPPQEPDVQRAVFCSGKVRSSHDSP